MRVHTQVGRIGIVLAASFAAGAVPCGAFTFDARRMGMGEVLLPGSGELRVANPAYHAAPHRSDRRGTLVPLPLGLAQVAGELSRFDPESASFDVLRIVDLALRPPFHVELREAAPLDGDIAIGVARDRLQIDFADLRGVLPQEPLRAGSIYSQPLASLGLRGARTFVAPILTAEGRVGLDPALHGVLAAGEPLLPNSSYELDAAGETIAGAGFNAGWAGGGWGGNETDGLYLGGFAKYLLGFAFGRAETRFGLVTADTIFGDTDPLDVRYDASARYAPFGRFGNGAGADLGALYRRGAFDFGAGVRDLGSFVRWGSTQLERSILDDATDEVTTLSVADAGPYTVHLPTQAVFNVAWTGRQTVVAADLTTSRWGTRAHVGAERLVGPVALRTGLLRDAAGAVQYAWGCGLGWSRVRLDIGFETHGYAFTGERGLSLGTSIAIR